MAETKEVRFIQTKMIAMILLPSFLWAWLLFVLPNSASFSLFLKVVLWGIPAYLFPRLSEKINPIQYLLLDRPPKVKWILFSIAFLTAYTVLIRGGVLEARPVSFFYVISAVVMSPVIEEIAFRGVILQLFQQQMRWWTANAATAVLFVLYHIPLWLVRGQGVSLMGGLWVLFFGVCMGYVMSQSRSLWTSILIHAVQNLLFGIL